MRSRGDGERVPSCAMFVWLVGRCRTAGTRYGRRQSRAAQIRRCSHTCAVSIVAVRCVREKGAFSGFLVETRRSEASRRRCRSVPASQSAKLDVPR